MQAELRKLAAQLREKVAQDKAETFVKCAQFVRGLTGLAILKRKLGKTT